MMNKHDDDTHQDMKQSIRSALMWDDSERQVELLRQRAKQYAAPERNHDPLASMAGGAITVLTFTLGKERYGVDVMVVRGVRVCPRLTPVPGTPPFYRGVVNVRGQIVSVMDIGAFFDIPPDSDDVPAGELVIVQAHGLEIGLVAGEVQDVVRIPRATLQPYEHLRYALGVTADRLVLLDISQLFQDERLIVGSRDD